MEEDEGLGKRQEGGSGECQDPPLWGAIAAQPESQHCLNTSEPVCWTPRHCRSWWVTHDGGEGGGDRPFAQHHEGTQGQKEPHHQESCGDQGTNELIVTK